MRVPGVGNLSRRIALRTCSETPNTEMGSDAVYGTPINLWASAEPVGGGIYYGSMQIGAAVTHRFIIRTGPDVSSEHVIEWDNRRFRIRRHNRMAEAMHYTVIEAEELGPL